MDKVTIPALIQKKKTGRKIAMLTAYDYLFAEIVDQAGIDVILVGDSLGMVVQGHETTLSVTMDEMIYHTKMVSRASRSALVVADMPFLSYHVSIEEAIRNAGRFLQEGGAAAVKIEGGVSMASRVSALTHAEIPVMAHIGMTPQSVHRLGGYKVQGREGKEADQLIADAKAVEDAGAFCLVVEAVPGRVAKKITETLTIPTIGIGAGPCCDGQVLVLYDLLGLFDKFTPKYVKRYASLKEEALHAMKQFKEEVELGKFPSDDESYP